MLTFNPQSILEELRTEAKAKRKGHYRHSQLDRYSKELVLLYEAGATPTEMKTWLRKQRLKVSLSTVTRWLDKNEIRSSQSRNSSD